MQSNYNKVTFLRCFLQEIHVTHMEKVKRSGYITKNKFKMWISTTWRNNRKAT